EGRYEGERTLREHGATPLRHLDRLGALGARTIAVHAVWLDDEEVALMGARDAALAYCPSSNMFLGDGVTRLPELLRAGVRAGLGTRSEEHTSELQSLTNLVCRLLLEKQKRY